ncbi:MAG: riboflavin synthase [Lachnospiraceae bacterium]|nr:riboflavin synthase [Lachnospiraceae bacterium]
MFTGIIEEVGTIKSIQISGNSAILTIHAKKVLENTKLGDSIAVNGVCLTATKIGSDYFAADVMAETVRRSSLGTLEKGSVVNLERAMAADGRFGGHIVSGHVDAMGTIEKIAPEDNAVWYTISADKKTLHYIVEKGSITIDGISLTVAYVDDTCFQVSIIPHTREQTNLPMKKVGHKVNLECDIIGKYVEKLMMPMEEEKESKITEDFLKKYGF